METRTVDGHDPASAALGSARDEAVGVAVVPLRLQAQSFAVGRLGPIYRALEAATGRIVTVECVELTLNDEASSPGVGESVEQVREMLERELDELRGKLPGVLWYDMAILDRHTQEHPVLLLVSRTNVGRTLAQLCKDFGRLHPLTVRQYVHALVRSVSAMHKIGLCCGGLSSSTVFVGADHAPRIGACFPSFSTVKHIEQSGILADASICRATLQRPLTTQEIAQDVRSVAYVMAEMLTGRHARGAFLLDLSRLVDSVGAGGQQHVAFLRGLLSTGSLTGELCQHPFLPVHPPQLYHVGVDEGGGTDQRDVTSGGDDAVLSTSAALQEQRRMIVALTRDELTKCQAQTREATQQMRVWFRGFERQYGRKPTTGDRPPTVIRLQARCRVLTDRISTLNERLDAVYKSFHRAAATPTEEAVSPPTTGDDAVGAPHPAMEIEIPQLDDANAAATLDRTGPRRSPAQNAFLNRHEKTSNAADNA